MSNSYQADLLYSIESNVLSDLGPGYTADMVSCYIDCTFTSQGMSSSENHRDIG